MGAQTRTVTANFADSKAGYLGPSTLNTLDPLYGADAQPCASTGSEEAFVAEFDALLTCGWYN